VTPLILVSIALAPITAWGCAQLARLMRQRGVGQHIRELGPQGHATKAGTPTMGGAIVLLAWMIGVLCSRLSVSCTKEIGFILAAGASHGLIGLADDLRSLRHRRSAGLSAAWKLLLGTFLAGGLFILFRGEVSVPQHIPFSTITITLPPIATFLVVWLGFLSTTNSMNLADGLDGLASGLTLLILVGLLVLSPSGMSLSVGLPLLATLVGFLWVNGYPAQIFLGDVGAFGLGGIIAAVSLCTGTIFFLPIVAGVLVLEAGSVIAQVSLFKLAGVRLFKMSPLHHHFEQSARPGRSHVLRGFEWPETKVTLRFWLLQAVLVGIAIWAGVGV